MASRAGYRYYSNFHTAVVCCGSTVAQAFLGGSWFNKGKAPKGFADLEAAIQHSCSVHGTGKVEVVVSLE